MTRPAPLFPPGLPSPATTSRKGAAEALAPLSAVRPKGDAEGVLSSLPCTVLTEGDADTPRGPRVVGYLEIKAPHKRPPTARSTCACGRDITARGAVDVHALIDSHAYHRTVCPLHDQPERRNAA